MKEDLENFYNALEWALMKFHKERMSVINRMVREMWHSTYKGKDIDYVEIRAEESAGVGNLYTDGYSKQSLISYCEQAAPLEDSIIIVL